MGSMQDLSVPEKAADRIKGYRDAKRIKPDHTTILP